ncbi:galactoside alpha-(1,2)-fucosyltransferase 2 [Aplysia californica]|uniref:L-Fucosyltransferase n=1 Tax=Aplysia californica TaxID=6500 RepID=A0ABM1A9D4_APLCA|nr:galactoside alpha-(1,2)-fucosyltransferase 2 [Aplysia californica]
MRFLRKWKFTLAVLVTVGVVASAVHFITRSKFMDFDQFQFISRGKDHIDGNANVQYLDLQAAVNNMSVVSSSQQTTLSPSMYLTITLHGHHSSGDAKLPHLSAVNKSVTKNNSSKQTNHSQPIFLTVAFEGRLGNQLFEYAAMLGLSRLQGRSPALPSAHSLLQDAFNITNVHIMATSADVRGWKQVTEAHYGVWDQGLARLPRENVTLKGYLQSWKYFAAAHTELREQLTFREHIAESADELLEEIRQKFPNRSLVGVHVRRGDFLKPEMLQLGYISPEATYYSKAFAHKRRELGQETPVLFVVVSNDRDWCAAHLNGSDVANMNGSDAAHLNGSDVANMNGSDVHIVRAAGAEVHLALLARTQHVIISAGSYSWWAGWLAGGKVIYYTGFPRPGSFLSRHIRAQDHFPAHWIGIGD